MRDIEVGIPPIVVHFSPEEMAKFWRKVRARRTSGLKAEQLDKLFAPFSPEAASGALQVLYRQYFERELDEVGLQYYSPYLCDYGFMGLQWVVSDLTRSGEMNDKVDRDLAQIYLDLLGRLPDEVGRAGYDKWIRFFGRLGREFVEQCVRSSDEYASRQRR